MLRREFRQRFVTAGVLFLSWPGALVTAFVVWRLIDDLAAVVLAMSAGSRPSPRSLR